MKKLVVTGGLGFIGSNFIKKSLLKNYKILNIDKITYAWNLDNLSSIKKTKTIISWMQILQIKIYEKKY